MFMLRLLILPVVLLVTCAYAAVLNKEPVCPAMFVSLLNEPAIFSSRKQMDSLIDFSTRSGVNTLFIQVYRENKAWFPSKIADSSGYDKCVNGLSFDPLGYIIEQAKKRGIKVHAWLNMLSLTRNKDSVFLKKYGNDVLTRNLKEKKELKDYLIDSQFFLEPADHRVRLDLRGIVEELLRAYPGLDGIQFDYIRYPDKEPHYGYTRANIERFQSKTGLEQIDEDSLVWKEWKRSQVTELLVILAQTARSINPGIQVSATGCMPFTRAYHEAYQDWILWIKNGSVDFVTVMNYSPDPREFSRWLAAIKESVPVSGKIKVGVGAYKLIGKPEIFDEEFNCVERAGMTAAAFHYDSLLEDKELQKIIARKNAR